MTTPVTITVKGTKADVNAKLDALKNELPAGSNVTGYAGDELADDAHYQGNAAVEVGGASRRADAGSAVAEALAVIDPRGQVIGGGDFDRHDKG